MIEELRFVVYGMERPKGLSMSRSFDTTSWALILGGSSGFGLASAAKLAANGMNVIIFHRDRRGAMARIEEILRH